MCGWINEKANRPVWAKMTPNITDITNPARTALAAGCEGVAAINTITSGFLVFSHAPPQPFCTYRALIGALHPLCGDPSPVTAENSASLAMLPDR